VTRSCHVLERNESIYETKNNTVSSGLCTSRKLSPLDDYETVAQVFMHYVLVVHQYLRIIYV
jgi:hypothetical protein